MEITKREIIASFSLLAILMIIGFIISDEIREYDLEQNKQYLQALKIRDKDIFEYAMQTNTGNAFVEGEMRALEPVTYDDLDKDYILVKKITEEYTMHTRLVTYTDSKGKSRTRTETYWTWDEIHRETKISKRVAFLDVEFKYAQFDFPSSEFIKTVKVHSDLRYKYYGIPKTFKATIYSRLSNGNINSENVPVYVNTSIEDVLEELTSNANQILFWCIWITLSLGMIYAFVVAENDWLNKD